ncbi:MAG: V-type ATPase subunit [Oscillospiraceae bacterium]|nr:V-type ATPase subunit [Oscillospiraceae bacterium]
MAKKAIKQDAYLCLSAMLRAREPRLLNDDRAQRMLDAPSFEEAAKILADCGYEDMSQMSAKEVEDALAKHRNEVFAEMAQLAPDKSIVDVFRMKYDYHNAKAIIKAEAMGTESERLLSGSGRVKPEVFLSAYSEGRFGDLPNVLGHATEEAKGVLARTANPQLADFVLDSAYFSEMKEIARESGNAFLERYAEVLIDSTNLKSAVRTLRMGKDAAFLNSVIIPGGGVSAERITGASDKEAMAALFAHTKLEKAAALGVDAVDGGSMTAFELACDNAVNDFLSDAKLVSFGCEPLVAYLAAVEGEITAVRMILTGRLAGIAPEVIRERLRDLYA